MSTATTASTTVTTTADATANKLYGRRPAPGVRGGVLPHAAFRSDILKYICEHCGFVFDEDEFIPGMGLPEGSGFYDLPDDWVCPLCGAAKDDFLPSE